MKKIYLVILISCVFFVFTSCGTTKKATKPKTIAHQKISEETKQKDETPSTDKKTNPESKKNESKNHPKNEAKKETEKSTADEDLIKAEKQAKDDKTETQVAEAITDPIELIDKPNLELILPEDENDDFSEIDKAEFADKAKLKKENSKKENVAKNEEKKAKKTKAGLAENSKNYLKKELNSKKNTADDYEESPETEKSDTNTKSEILSPEEESAKESNKFLKEASASNEENIEKSKTADENTIVPEPHEEIFLEFPNTEPNEPSESEESYQDEQTEITRKVKLYKGQRLEVVYPGQGWVYLGETSAQKGIKYQQRILQDDASIFNFAAEKPGRYILNFSYFDVFSDNFVMDSLFVTVGEEKEGVSNTVRAPDYKGEVKISKAKEESKPETVKNENQKGLKPAKKQKFKEAKEQVVPADNSIYDMPDISAVEEKESNVEENVNSNLSAREMLEKIGEFVDEAKAKDALNLINTFFMKYSDYLDEAWFLRGQAYELNGKEKNIKKALSAYKTLTKAYPESNFWDDADARIRYIKKFYINID